MTDLFAQSDAQISVDDVPPSGLRRVFAFPNPVNDYAARATAGLVVALGVAAIVVDQWWLYAILFAGFVLRVAGGPKYSPFGQLAVHVIVPKVIKREKLVPGPPKRFAQTIGVVFSGTALVLSLLHFGLAAQIVTGGLVAAAFLESAFGLCLGCLAFGYLQRWGVIPQSVCEECNKYQPSAD